MAEKPADPALFYERHIFCAPTCGRRAIRAARCIARAAGRRRREAARLCREKARQLGIEKIRCNAAGCLDRCEFGPNMVIYPEGVWYRYENTADLDEILEMHVKNGGRVERLMLHPTSCRRSTEAAAPRHDCFAALAMTLNARHCEERSDEQSRAAHSDTIYAPATAPGRAAIAIIRLTGPQAGPALQALAGALPPPRMARHVRVRDPDTGEALDDGLALWFPGPRSATGEDVAELHLHGSRAVLAAVMAALRRGSGLRLAEPGEFTRRAFLNGKLDLTQAEAVADLAAAETEAQRRQALRQLDGELGGALPRLGRAAAAPVGASRSRDRFPRRGPAARDRERGSRPTPLRWPARSSGISPTGIAASGCATASRWRSSGRRTPANRAC